MSVTISRQCPASRRFASLLFMILLLTAGYADEAIKVPLQTRRAWDYDRPEVHFDCHFSGARLNGCEQLGTNEFRVLITPENEPINNSPWYAFKVRAAQRQTITLDLVNTYALQRGRPWLSVDGKNWHVADREQYANRVSAHPPVLRLAIGPEPVWVAAWDIVSLPQINDWMEALASRAGVEIHSAGNSIEGRPLRYFILGAATNAGLVFVIGRQHPPEITGTIGLERFVETLAGDTPLAREYRRHFQTVVVPVVNPDGVEHGHWRSNLGGVDLNRDWQDFSQPETRAVRDLFLKLAAATGGGPQLFLDFHSTGTNIFYAQPEAPGDRLPGFADRWLAGLRAQLPAFGFERDDRHNATLATGKDWVHGQWHIPSLTCEFGYQTDRLLIQHAGEMEAVGVMKLLLARFGQ